ncbi:Fragile X mental retardation protein [Caligus rogercresseyi]|uniref:Fragile X mental retardation protein n=1 Tax=Caligus rogercresseyi TaxID=217165 RepID=A0A7T8KAY0_CALRO|nr:Fragile X mental retardation protein [Caligus rogercresseyi]
MGKKCCVPGCRSGYAGVVPSVPPGDAQLQHRGGSGSPQHCTRLGGLWLVARTRRGAPEQRGRPLQLNLRRGAPGLQPSGPPGLPSPSIQHATIQDKDFYSNLDAAALRDEGNYAEDEDSHAVFVKSINACSVKYEPAKRSLRVVSTDEDTQESRHDPGHALSKLHTEGLLKSKTEEVERHLEATRIQSTYGYT